MNIYQVLDGDVTWPDGSVRASAGECFESHDDSDIPTLRSAEQVWLAPHRTRIELQPEGTEALAYDPPAKMCSWLALRGVDIVHPGCARPENLLDLVEDVVEEIADAVAEVFGDEDDTAESDEGDGEPEIVDEIIFED